MTVLLAVASGLLIGLSLGALGGGGSILAVPALVYLLGQPAHQATTVSLVVVAAAALTGAVLHGRAGRVRLKEGAAFGVLGVAGSYAGSLASNAIAPDVLLAGFGALMLAVAGVMTMRVRTMVPVPAALVAQTAAGPGETGPRAGQRAARPAHAAPERAGLLGMGSRPLLIATAATGVGLITGFFGVGGGFIVVPVLLLVLGFDMPTAAGTSLVVIAVDSAAALAARVSHGWPHIGTTPSAIFAAGAIVGALAGSRVAGRVNPRRLSAAFTVVILVVAAYTLFRALPGLA